LGKLKSNTETGGVKFRELEEPTRRQLTDLRRTEKRLKRGGPRGKVLGKLEWQTEKKTPWIIDSNEREVPGKGD